MARITHFGDDTEANVQQKLLLMRPLCRGKHNNQPDVAAIQV